MQNILLEDLLRLQGSASRVKIKLNMRNEDGEEPLDIWLDKPEGVNNDWLFWRTETRYFEEGDIAVCLVRIYTHQDLWLLTTVKKVVKELGVFNGVNYEGSEMDEYKKYFGRVIVKYHNDVATICRHYDGLADRLVVTQILPATYDKSVKL